MSKLRSTDVIIIGGGFAGASTAAALTRLGVTRITIVEQEAICGQHGTGRNAAMARRLIEDPVLTQLAIESVTQMGPLEERRGRKMLEVQGGLLLGSAEAVGRLSRVAARFPELGARRVSPAEASELVPPLAGARFEAGIFSPGCAVVDIHELLTAYLDEARAAGARLRVGTRIEGIEVAGGRVKGVRTTDERLACDLVVNAAGPWANGVAAMAGLPALPFDPARRHLFVTARYEAYEGVKRWPFVWDTSSAYYFRPEGAGLLMCACDQTSWDVARQGGDAPTDPEARERLAEKFARIVPGLSDARPARGWAGLRVLTPDGRFAIGPEAALEGYFWVAGLGGHGMTTSARVGEIAALGITEGQLPAPYAEAFSPARFAR